MGCFWSDCCENGCSGSCGGGYSETIEFENGVLRNYEVARGRDVLTAFPLMALAPRSHTDGQPVLYGRLEIDFGQIFARKRRTQNCMF